jgi:sulfate permease, SulP family
MPTRVSSLTDLGRRVRRLLAEHPVRLCPCARGWDGYRRADAIDDLRAGLNVALLAVPQGMAFAMIAGMPVVAGIACALVGALAAAFFCASRHVALGPTNATAFTVFSFFATYPALGARQAELMPLLAVLVAILLVAGAFFHVADLVQYISRSVMVGYITGAAALIIASQLPDLLGIDLAGADGSRPRTFLLSLWRLAASLGQVEWAALAAAAITLASLGMVARWRPRWPAFALALVAGSAAVAGLSRFHPAFGELAMLAPFAGGDLLPRLPDWSPRLLDDIGALFGLALAIAFLAALETSIMVKGLASRGGGKLNLDQDLYGAGLANVASALVGGMPASSSLTRSALMFATGVKSRLGMLVNGLGCLAIALLIGPLVAHVPRAVLGALVVAVAWKLFNLRQIRICLTATRSDAATLVATLVAALLVPLYVAIFSGVALSILLYLRKAARPELVEYEFNDQGSLAEASNRRIPAISIVHVEGDLFFGAAELFRTQIQRTMADPMLKVIILRLRNARNLDATSVMALEDLVHTVRADGRHLLISGITRDVYRVLRNAGLLDVINRRNLFMHSFGNPNLSTRNALARAQELLGTREADIQIFIDQNKKRPTGG